MMIKIIYNDPNLSAEQLNDLYSSIGWNKEGFRTLSRTEQAIQNSLCHCSAYDTQTEKLIGFSRLVGDGSYVIQLVDLMVSEPYRGQKISRKLIDKIVDEYISEEKYKNIMLVDGSGIKNLYSSMGFDQ